MFTHFKAGVGNSFRFDPGSGDNAQIARFHRLELDQLESASVRNGRHSGDKMTVNVETLKASLLLYGLNALYASLLLAIGWKLSGVAQQVVSRLLAATHGVDALVIVFLASLARYAVLAVVGIAVLQLFGIQTASLVAVLGATSLAIGLALQGTLSNLAAGVMLLLFRPFHIGDDVEVAGKAGKGTRIISVHDRAGSAGQ